MKSIHSLQELKICRQSRYNGQLNIRNTEGKQWPFYYHLGQLVWAIGGTHPSLSNNWIKAGLAGFSPDLALVLIKPEELRKQVSPGVFKNYEVLINGKSTLWDLPVKMKRNILSITRLLLPYIHPGITALV